MELLDCCNTASLKLIKRVYQTNADIFDVKQCPSCQTYWLYRCLEENWWDNLQLNQNEYEAWYVPLEESELDQVYEMDLSKIEYREGFTHIRTTVPLFGSSEWKKLRVPKERSRN
jgi:hypothetical protein